jgi:hypothetical protein
MKHEKSVDVREATHVFTRKHGLEAIQSKWGIRDDGTLCPPSEGGFGVITECGRRVTMWEVDYYRKIS